MLVNNQISESIGSGRWSLAGWVTTAAQLTLTSHSLKLIRRFDGLSSQIKFAMNARSALPVVEINTPSGKVTLVNAKIVMIVPVPRTAPHRPRGVGNHELEEVDITFMSITYSRKGKKDFSDDWNIGG